MLALDSLVIDLIFNAGATPKPEALLAALGGEEVASSRRILDPDMEDPRFEMEVSPSLPMRRRGERRLLIMDESVAPMRKDPRTDPLIPLDLRAEKERLIALCQIGGVRLGRLNALGSWGDAVLVARAARDLRAISLLMWVLDPSVDADGRKRPTRLTQQDFEAKLATYEKRLDELDERQILASTGPARFERRGELLVLDVLEPDGTWDVRKSYAVEMAMAAIDRFSTIPGAPSAPPAPTAATRPTTRGKAAAPPSRTAAPMAAVTPPPAPVKAGPPLGVAEVDGRVVLIFPKERFDLDIAAALGKRDWNAVVRSNDPVGGQLRDRVQRDGAGFLAPLEFLSEVFIDGKPLSRPQFDAAARPVGGTARSLEVHCPRFGPVLLLDVTGKGRFITSELSAGEKLVALVP